MPPLTSTDHSACPFSRLLVQVNGALTDVCTPYETGHPSAGDDESVIDFLESSGAGSETWDVFADDEVVCLLFVTRHADRSVMVELTVAFKNQPACEHHTASLQDLPAPPQPKLPSISSNGRRLTWVWTIPSHAPAARFVPEISAYLGDLHVVGVAQDQAAA
jgi:hypothetical protein